MHIFAISPEKYGSEFDVLPVDKDENFLQVDNITVGVRSQVSPKYRNNKFTISLQYLNENVKDEVDFLSADKRQKASSN